MTTTALTIDTVHNLMDKSYTLVYVDYTMNLNNSLAVINECIKEKSATPLYDHITDWFSDIESNTADEYLEELKTKCTEHDYSDTEVEQFFEEYKDAIRDEIYKRDDSNTFRQLLRNTAKIPVRVVMHSNYDCINSHYFEGTYCYHESYFGAMVDALNLNPSKVAETFEDAGINYEDDFPDKSERNGNELVSYHQLAVEISNSVSPANNLIFIAMVDLEQLHDNEFELTEVTLPKGNVCGLFSSVCGGGSILEMELLQDVTLKLDEKPYDYYSLEIDTDTHNGYSIKETYGVIDSFFGKPLTIKKQVA